MKAAATTNRVSIRQTSHIAAPGSMRSGALSPTLVYHSVRLIRIRRASPVACAAVTLVLALSARADAQTGFDPGADGPVNVIVVQPDGKILVGGLFNHLGGGGTGTAARKNIGRLNADGSIDTSFDPGTVAGAPTSGAVYALALQPDGKILVGGDFTGVAGSSYRYLARLNADGSSDASWRDTNPQGPIYAIALQPDGKVLVGGHFRFLFLLGPRMGLARLTADGDLDAGFDPGVEIGTFGAVVCIAVQPDGKIIVGGSFIGIGNGTGDTPRSDIGRINADGTLDASFDPGASFITSDGDLGTVASIIVQPDNNILVGGRFSLLGGGGIGVTARRNIGRLTPAGAIDASFDPGAGDILDPDVDQSSVLALVLQADGKIVLGGEFKKLGGGGIGTTARNFLGRVAADGSLDATFDPGALASNQFSSVNVLMAQPGGDMLVGGSFKGLGGGTGTIVRNNIGRVSVAGAVDGITLSAAAFTAATAGTSYSPVTITQTGGVGTTTFAVTAGALPSGMSLSSEGVVSGTPTQVGVFGITVGAADTAAHSGARVFALTVVCQAITLSATALATGSLGAAYPNTAITQSGGIGATTFAITSGALPPGMTVSANGVVGGTPTAAGTFNFTLTATDSNSCTGTRSYALTTAGVAPSIAVQPAGTVIQTAHAAQLSVTAAGDAPLTYQWYAGQSGNTGNPVAGATSAAYLTAALSATASYWVRVTNPFGAADSAAAVVTVVPYVPFTDETLAAGTSPIRVEHIEELRARINSVRLRYGLSAFAFADAPVSRGATGIKAQHILELRTALSEAYVAAHRTPPSFTDPSLGAGTPLKLVHILELRAALIAIE